MLHEITYNFEYSRLLDRSFLLIFQKDVSIFIIMGKSNWILNVHIHVIVDDKQLFNSSFAFGVAKKIYVQLKQFAKLHVFWDYVGCGAK